MSNWSEINNHLERKIKTPDFMTSLNLVTAIAILAEEINHHPDVKLGWGYLDITLTTHDEKKITSKDYLLADRIDKLITEWDGVQ